MDKWINGRVDGSMDEWTDGWIDGSDKLGRALGGQTR